jgi:hypothetical protein
LGSIRASGAAGSATLVRPIAAAFSGNSRRFTSNGRYAGPRLTIMIPMGFPIGLEDGPLALRVASTGRNPSGFAGSAREQARRILDGPQYQSRPARSFQPLTGALGAIGRWFERVFGPAWRWVAHHLFHPVGNWLTSDIGLPWPVTVLAIALVVGVVVGVVMIRRRPKLDFEEIGSAGQLANEDPMRLEELALQAERAGDLRAAVRLRFRAGVADLEKLGLINRGVTRTTRQLSDLLGSAEFDVLAEDLESIVYGGATATPEHAEVARSGWPVVKLEAERKVEAKRSAARSN